MDDRSEHDKTVLGLPKRSRFVFGSFLHARTSRFHFLGILIVMGIAQLSATAQGQDQFLAISQQEVPALPVESLLDWSLPNRAIGCLSPVSVRAFHPFECGTEETDNVFLTTGNTELCEWVSCGACSDSCTATENVIPWSRWDEGRSCCEFASHDVVTLFRNLDDDFVALWRLRNVAFVGAGLGLSLGLRHSVDDDVREYTARHPQRWGGFSDAWSVLGNTEYQIAGMAILYGYAYHRRDDELMDFTRLLVRSYTMTGLSTLLIKGIANTSRPSETWNNGHFGFPSAHVSTSFAIAATIEEYYGPQAGIPAYLMAGLVGWSRIDDRDHDLSDVVFGAVLGYAIAKSIAGQELRGDSRIRMCPWMEPGNRTVGAIWEIDF